MCQRCNNVKAAIKESIQGTPFEGTANVLHPLIVQCINAGYLILRDRMPESAMAENPYDSVVTFFKAALAAAESEQATTLKHDAIVENGEEVIDAEYEEVADPDEQKLIDLGNDILKDMQGEGT